MQDTLKQLLLDAASATPDPERSRSFEKAREAFTRGDLKYWVEKVDILRI
jgi:hypothetical protein